MLPCPSPAIGVIVVPLILVALNVPLTLILVALMSFIKAFPHILPLTPKLPLVLIKGTMFPLAVISPLTLIFTTLKSRI